MTTMLRRRRPLWAWLVGAAVLLALGFAFGRLLRGVTRDRAAPAAAASDAAPVVPSLDVRGPAPADGRRATLRGRVVQPGGAPAGGTTVSLYRAVTAWPEWRRERIDQVTTVADGMFEFPDDGRPDLLLGFEHASFAGGLEEVPWSRSELELQLQPGFELGGLVTNDVGVPLSNARVAIESLLVDQRRATAVSTGADGRYTFRNLAGGPVRLVVRHERWQPEIAPLVVVGETRRVDVRCSRPALLPLRGRVLAAVTQSPVAGAVVELMVLNTRAGLVDPVATTTGADGSFEIGGLARGAYRLLVRHPEHGATARPMTIGAVTSEQLVELPPRSRLQGRLVADAGLAPQFAGAVLRCRDSSGQLAWTKVETDGRFVFADPLSPGWATMTAQGAPFAFERASASDASVWIEEAAVTEAELVVQPPTIVRGRILDDRGEPLAAATVHQTRVFAESVKGISDAITQLDLGTMRNQFEQLISDRDQLLAVSAADGTFEIRGVKPGPLLLRLDLPGRGGRWRRIQVPVATQAAEEPPVVLSPGCTVRGVVRRGDRICAGAIVSVVGESQAMTVSREDGSFVFRDLQAGNYRLRARLPSSASTVVERLVAARDPRTPVVTDLMLPMGRIVRGTVTGSDGQPVVGASVTIRGVTGQPTFSDAAGSFALELPDRAGELVVALADRSRQRVVGVGPGDEPLVVRLDTPPTCTIVAQVAALPGKKRLAGALLRVESLAAGAGEGARARWVDLQNGELRWSACPTGRVRVQIACEGYVPFVVERDFEVGKEHSLGELLLEPGAVLQGLVVDGAGAPVASAVVLLGEETDMDVFEPRCRSDGDGRFVVAGVSSRSSRVVVWAPGFAPSTVDLLLPQDVLVPSPRRFVLEPGSAIEVAVGRGVPRDGAFVLLRRQGRVLASAELDDSGRAVFTNRGAGDYEVQLFGSELPAKTVRVSGSGRLYRVALP